MKKKEAKGKVFYPSLINIFSWTRVPGCEPDNVKVIIVGQDPIPRDEATGWSFENYLHVLFFYHR